MVVYQIGLHQKRPDRSSCLNFSVNGSNGLTVQWRFLATIYQAKNSAFYLQKWKYVPYWLFLKSIVGSVLALLNSTDGSIWTHLNGTYGPTLGFPLNLLPLDFHRRGILVNHS